MTSFDIEKEYEGKTYKARAHIDKGMLTDSSVTLGSKHAKVSSNNEFLASLLFQELIDDHLKQM